MCKDYYYIAIVVTYYNGKNDSLAEKNKRTTTEGSSGIANAGHRALFKPLSSLELSDDLLEVLIR